LTGIDNPKTGYSIFNIKLGGEFVGLGALFLLSSNDLSFTGAFEGTISHSLINDIILPSNKLISQPSPIITSFSPTGGNNITEILINGGHLLSTQQVKFTVGNITGSALITGITD